ncbi:unnamed protein product, partial [Prorocentrum cordatum]
VWRYRAAELSEPAAGGGGGVGLGAVMRLCCRHRSELQQLYLIKGEDSTAVSGKDDQLAVLTELTCESAPGCDKLGSSLDGGFLRVEGTVGSQNPPLYFQEQAVYHCDSHKAAPRCGQGEHVATLRLSTCNVNIGATGKAVEAVKFESPRRKYHTRSTWTS